MKHESFYMPVLKWKQGEYLALKRLDAGTKLRIRPLIELVSPNAYDFESGKTPKTLDEHLAMFVKRYQQNWDNREAYICMTHIKPHMRMADGSHPLFWVFNELDGFNITPTPTIFLNSDEGIHGAIQLIQLMCKTNKLAIRIKLEDLLEGNLQEQIDGLLEKLGYEVSSCDLILDAGAPNFNFPDAFLEMLVDSINSIPHLMKWKNFSMCSTSFPQSMAEIKSPMQVITRSEWLIYKQLRKAKDLLRLPNFGDYSIGHPQGDLLLDMRKVKPSGKVRYATRDSWVIFKGPNVRDNGFSQFVQHCKNVIALPEFDGADTSYADKYIKDCAEGKAKTGTLTTWKTIDNNRHITRVVRDLFANAA